MLNEFGAAPLSIQGERCLNARHRDAGCRLCVDACPTDAIEHPNASENGGNLEGPEQLRLHPDRCVNCGLCLHLCPTDVFSQQGAPEDRLAQTLSSLTDAALALVCPQHQDPAFTSAPVDAVVRHKRCLASLSPARLIELADGGQRNLWLDDTPCAECPIGQVQRAIAQAVTTTNRLLEAFGRLLAIRTALNNPCELNERPNAQPVVEGDHVPFSRRGFFGALGQLTRRVAATAVDEGLSTEPPGGPLPVDQRLPQRIPASRGYLHRQLMRLGAPAAECIATDGIPYAEVIVDSEGCLACGMCVRFCPTGALSLLTSAESFALCFQPIVCIDCGICADACPETAVSFGSQLRSAALIMDKPQALVTGSLGTCTDCGQPSATRNGDAPRCYVCRHRAGVDAFRHALSGMENTDPKPNPE